MAPKKKGGKDKEGGAKADKKPTGPTEEQREELRLKVCTLAAMGQVDALHLNDSRTELSASDNHEIVSLRPRHQRGKRFACADHMLTRCKGSRSFIQLEETWAMYSAHSDTGEMRAHAETARENRIVAMSAPLPAGVGAGR